MPRFLGGAFVAAVVFVYTAAASDSATSRTVSRSALPPQPASAWTEEVLFAFNGSPPYGRAPSSPLVPDGKGNFFGTTASNGNFATACTSLCGTVFELSPPAPGKNVWQQQVLHTFSGSDGSDPGPLHMDAKGNLFGTALSGGNSTCYSGAGCGVIFELTPPAMPSGQWAENTIYAFSGPDGVAPSGSLSADSSGSLYGVTIAGGGRGIGRCGNFGCGEVFKLAPPAPGKKAWSETIPYSFGANEPGSRNGVLVNKGVVYGTLVGDRSDNGRIFALAHTGPSWKETVLHTFAGRTDGYFPSMNLIADSSGALYGTTANGGGSVCGCGTVFKLAPPAPGQTEWKETILHAFQGSDGAYPGGNGQLLVDSHGALYATTSGGGTGCFTGCGTAFKLAPPAAGKNGPWLLTTLVFFDRRDGFDSGAGLTNYDGLLYGSTRYGGNSACREGCGVLFQLSR